MVDPGQLLRRTRVARGLKQAELAYRAGTTQSYISRVERGAVSPSMFTLNRILHAMGQRLRLDVEPLPHGNVTAHELRSDFRALTAGERVERAMELSAFLTGTAASAHRPPHDNG